MRRIFATIIAIWALCGCTPMHGGGAQVAAQEQPDVAGGAQVAAVAGVAGVADSGAEASAAELARLVAPVFGKSLAVGVAHVEGVRNPSAAQVLYLMRAARYAEAAEAALRVDGAAMRFVAVKARILAHRCTDGGCWAEFDDAFVGELAAETGLDRAAVAELCERWRVRGRIEEANWGAAMAGIGAHAGERAWRGVVLALIGKLIDAAFLVDGGEIDWDRLGRQVSEVSGGNAFESATLAYAAMRIAQRRGDERRAREKADQIVLRYPATQMALWPELASSEDLARYSPKARYGRIGRLISHFDYDNARRELKALLEDGATPAALAAEAEWEYARVSLTNSEDPALSGRIYEKYAHAKGAKGEDATFGIARSLSRQLKYREAIEALEAYDRRYPRGKYAKRSLYLRGWYAFDLRANDEARPLLKAYAEATNDTSVWGFYAQSFLRDGDWAEAIKAFDKLYRAGNPIVRGKAMYWQAYAQHALGNDDEARRLFAALHEQYPLTWYDVLALAREDAWFGASRAEAVEAMFRAESDKAPKREFYPFGYGSAVKQVPERHAIYREIMGYLSIDEVETAREIYLKHESSLLGSVSAGNRDDFRLYMTHMVESYYRAWQDVAGSIRAMSGTIPERSNPRHRMAYPQPFAPLVESLAHRYGVPKYFIYGIMLQESRFRPWQVSSADAIGALQMIPKTARVIADDLGLKYDPDTFFDPKVGFVYSVYYMQMHRKMWGGNLAFTAGSYNGGPHRIGPWALRDNGKTLDIVVDEFSFDESRHYTRKVAEHALRFAYMYATSVEEWREMVYALFPVVVPEIEARDDWGI